MSYRRVHNVRHLLSQCGCFAKRPCGPTLRVTLTTRMRVFLFIFADPTMDPHVGPWIPLPAFPSRVSGLCVWLACVCYVTVAGVFFFFFFNNDRDETRTVAMLSWT